MSEPYGILSSAERVFKRVSKTYKSSSKEPEKIRKLLSTFCDGLWTSTSFALLWRLLHHTIRGKLSKQPRPQVCNPDFRPYFVLYIIVPWFHRGISVIISQHHFPAELGLLYRDLCDFFPQPSVWPAGRNGPSVRYCPDKDYGIWYFTLVSGCPCSLRQCKGNLFYLRLSKLSASGILLFAWFHLLSTATTFVGKKCVQLLYVCTNMSEKTHHPRHLLTILLSSQQLQ